MSTRERLDDSDIGHLGGLVGELKLVACSDGGCVFGHPGGMATNGGCKCLLGLPDNRRRIVMRALRVIRMDLPQLLSELQGQRGKAP